MEQKEEIEKKIFFDRCRGSNRVPLDLKSLTLTSRLLMELKFCKKYLGIHQKFIQEQKFLEDFGEHLRGEQKNKPFLINSDFSSLIFF